MDVNRRCFLHLAGAGACGSLGLGAEASASDAGGADLDGAGMLVDLAECIGCRECEWACAQANGLSDAPLQAFEDQTVFDSPRRMTPDEYTVVNRYASPSAPDHATYVKSQCMHCVDPGCVSACLVGALTKSEAGPVIYDAWKCIGCRYCMVACPFEVPAYEFDDAFAPRVRKCSFCFERISKPPEAPARGETWVEQDIFETGLTGIPACAEQCPPQALTFGKRRELLEVARQRIAASPERYVDHIYGEHEVGGLAWLYLAPQPFEELGFQEFPDEPVPRLSEAIQHSVLRYGLPPLLVFGMLGGLMKVLRPDEAEVPEAATPPREGGGT